MCKIFPHILSWRHIRMWKENLGTHSFVGRFFPSYVPFDNCKTRFFSPDPGTKVTRLEYEGISKAIITRKVPTVPCFNEKKSFAWSSNTMLKKNKNIPICSPNISITYPKSLTLPLDDAVIVPSPSNVYSAEILSCRNRPSGSFLLTAYHFPAY